MKAAVILFPGSNRDRDVRMALAASTGRDPLVVWHKERDFPEVDLIVIPGGFSYGDYLRSGAMAAHSPVMREVASRTNKGVPVLGICNGFQILTEAGLLPGVLMPNTTLKFVCKDVYLKVENNRTPFTAKYGLGQVIRIPIAHHEGSYFADDETLAGISHRGQVALRYCQPSGEVDDVANPNGSIANIAGLFNETGTVLGLMPHPERLAESLLGGTDGKAMFDGLMEALS